MVGKIKEIVMIERLSNLEATKKIVVFDTVFVVKNISVRDRVQWAEELSDLTPEGSIEQFDKFLDILSKYVVSIEGYEESPKEVLGKLTERKDFASFITSMRFGMGLSETESKN